MNQLLVGAVADDLTGACDLAAAMTEAGIPTQVIVGVPDDAVRCAAPGVVVALRSRTGPVESAVADSVQAARWLLENGARVLYQKYCSTFDSTATGNIGPVADALAELLASPDGASPVSIGTPATPAVGRTQYCGHLFVNCRLLSESSMRDHPLTPMRDADIVRVLSRQSAKSVGFVGLAAVAGGVAATTAAIAEAPGQDSAHILVDALTDADLDTIARAVLETDADARGAGTLPVLLGGAAGLGGALARALADIHTVQRPSEPAHATRSGARLIVCGSASEQSRRQRAAFDGPVISVDPLAALSPAEIRSQLDAAFPQSGGPVLVEAASDPEHIRAAQQKMGTERAASLVEDALSDAAVHAIAQCGVSELIVAGGETSGAVARALGIRSLTVRRLAAPGVPWMTVDDPQPAPLAVLFKSGNFGDDELFTTAWESAP